MNADDWKALKVPLIMLTLVVMVGFWLINSLGQSRIAAEAERRKAVEMREKAGANLKNIDLERNLIERYRDLYKELEQGGFIGAEQRLKMLESLRLANQKLQLFGVDYDIGAQHKYPYEEDLTRDLPPRAILAAAPVQANPAAPAAKPASRAPSLTFHESIMNIKLGLLHEGDLTRFLGTLDTAALQVGAGVFAVNQCTMERIDTGGSIRFQPNLRTECELAWITVNPILPTDKKS